MSDERIKEFISKFEDMLNDSNVPENQIVDDPAIGEGFKDLGFHMDCGKSFEEKYGSDAFRSPEALEKVIDSINDIHLLGTALFSKWRYYNHWAMGESIRAEESMRWCNMIIKRMQECRN